MLYVISLIGGVILTAGIYIVIPHIYKLSARKIFIRKAQRSGLVFLTFDDGPDPGSTPQILDILDETGTKATFFLSGRNMELYPGIVRDIVDRGHDVGFHGYLHTYAFGTGPLKTLQDISNVTDLDVFRHQDRVLYRPPYGKFNIVSMLYCIFHRWIPVFWSLDPRDYAADTPQQVTAYITERVRPGDVIFFT